LFITKGVSKLGMTLCLFLGTLLFYEGVPFLNWWPVNVVPGVSWVVTGEVHRRSVTIAQKAVLGERKLWEVALEEATMERNQIVEEKNRVIAEIEKQGLEEDKVLDTEQEALTGDLSLAIERCTEEQESEDTDCNTLDNDIPDGVYEYIR